MLILVIGLILISEYAKIRAIVTTNPTLPYEYSDDELIMDALPQDEGYDIYAMIRDADKKYDIDDGFLHFCAENENIDPLGTFTSTCLSWIESMGYDDGMWEDLTGYTFSVLYDLYTGAALSGGDGDIKVLGDVYVTKKTVILLMGDGCGGIIPDGIGAHAKEDITVFSDGAAEEKDVEYYISGGLKFAVVYIDADTDTVTSASAVSIARSVSDVVIAVVKNGSAEDAAPTGFISAGADLVVYSVGDGTLEYVTSEGDAVPVINGISQKGEGAAYMTLSLTVGVKPILRYYPLSPDGEPLTEEEMMAEIAARNPLFITAVVADDFKVRER